MYIRISPIDSTKARFGVPSPGPSIAGCIGDMGWGNPLLSPGEALQEPPTSAGRLLEDTYRE